ncbi:DNA-directed RNA polymerase subunit beta' [Candidatus Vidania fulgoroideorum]
MKINKIHLKILSPKEIVKISFGEVKSSETINYRTLKPEFEGLFCEKIFGPTKSYECYCKKYSGVYYKNKKCEVCKVDIVNSNVRRKRMGYIKLNSYLVNTLFYKVFPSKLSLILNIKSKKLESLIYLEKLLIIKNPVAKYKKYGIISLNKYEELKIEFGKKIKSLSGGEAIYKLLKRVNLKKEYNKIKKKILENKNLNKKEIYKFEIFKSFIKNKIKPEWIVLKNLPVLPPGLRPLVELENGKFVSSDLNELYRRIINRNNRLKSIDSPFFPSSMIIDEKRNLQESLDSLFCVGDSGNNFYRSYKKSLKSILDILKGKTGRFRQNLLGKRVDYSARSVIISEPNMKINNCYIPKKIAVEIFKPFIINILINKKYIISFKNIDYFYNNQKNVIYKILKKICLKFRIILNRAPTLHRLGIQAFKIKLTNEKAIKIHPLVCFSYNADFDGDQMAAHLPISKKTINECKKLLNPYNNLFLPSNGSFAYFPNQEILLGLYLQTLRNKNKKIKLYYKIKDCLYDLKINHININNNIYVFIKKKIELTTYGRVLIYNKIKKIKDIKFSLINKNIRKKNIQKILKEIYLKAGKINTFNIIEKLTKIGFNFSTKFGFSLCYDDIITTKKKKIIVNKMFSKIKNFFSKKEYFNKTSKNFEKTWFYSYKKIQNKVIKKINKKRDNPFSIILLSGAKSNFVQIKQISIIKGFLINKLFKIPLFSSFFEGINNFQYFLSTYSSRKGLTDTSLKTADSGYLTRRLVNICQNVIISEYDCKTTEGLNLSKKSNADLKGRYSVRNLYYKNKLVLSKKKIIKLKNANYIIKKNFENFKIRSPIFCKSKIGICSKCYGINLANDRLAQIGDVVGVISAQSIGEPGTQLTMRTFHMSGNIDEKTEYFRIFSNFKGFIRFSQKLKCKKNEYKEQIVISKNEKIFITKENEEIVQKIKLNYGDKILYNNGTYIGKGILIVERFKFLKVLYIIKNKTKFKIEKNWKKKCSFKKKRIDKNKYILKIKKLKKEINIMLKFKNKKFKLKKKHYYLLRNNKKFKEGDIFILKKTKSKYNENITNSLERIERILEVRGDKKPFETNLNINFVSNYFINKIQKIYIKQNVDINNKHFEVVLKQMFNTVIIKNNIDENIYKGKKISRKEITKKRIKYPNLKYNNIVEGITKTSVNSKSFISAASFQETGKVLSEATLLCKKDKLLGIKENIIVGKLIPAGTGFLNNVKNRKIKKKTKKKTENK